jgi:hypothetical protein
MIRHMDTDRLLDEAATVFRERLRARLELDRVAGMVASEEAIGEYVAAAVELLPRRPPAGGRWNDVVGPFHDWRGAVARLDGIASRQALDRRRDAGQVLGCKTADRVWLYPTFQFDGRAVVRGLDRVLPLIVGALPDDGWSAALWLVTGNGWLDGDSPIDWLRHDRPVSPIEEAGRLQAAQWGER